MDFIQFYTISFECLNFSFYYLALDFLFTFFLNFDFIAHIFINFDFSNFHLLINLYFLNFFTVIFAIINILILITFLNIFNGFLKKLDFMKPKAIGHKFDDPAVQSDMKHLPFKIVPGEGDSSNAQAEFFLKEYVKSAKEAYEALKKTYSNRIGAEKFCEILNEFESEKMVVAAKELLAEVTTIEHLWSIGLNPAMPLEEQRQIVAIGLRIEEKKGRKRNAKKNQKQEEANGDVELGKSGEEAT